MILKDDCNTQLQKILRNTNSDLIKNYNTTNIEKCFSYLYIINFISKKIELKRFFKTKYYIVSYSCLIESFVLLLENYPRGSSLVLRSALENFIKSVIEISGEGKYPINDRSYGENRKTLDKLIEQEYPQKYREIFKRTNAQMHSTYGKLSGLSHSLTPESQNNLLEFFSDVNVLNKENIDNVFNKLLSILEYIFMCSLLISRSSLENWERSNLNEILGFTFGKKRTANLLELFS